MFIGPPFHAMPLAQVVDYGLTGVVFNITQPGPWLPAGQATNLELPSEMQDRLLPSPLNIIQVSSTGCLGGDVPGVPRTPARTLLAPTAVLPCRMQSKHVPDAGGLRV